MAMLDLITERHGDTIRIALRGELDISSAGRVETTLTEAEDQSPAAIVLDLRALEFMDSTGLRTVVSADARARDAGRRLAVVRGPDAVQRIFRITRLDERLEMVDDPDAVVA